MPAEILEKPTEVEEVAEQNPEAATFPSPAVLAVEQPKARPVKSLWRRIFEGHEEFLGWTPD